MKRTQIMRQPFLWACQGTTTNPRKFCRPFDIPPIPPYSSPRVLSETPPCVDPLSNIWVIHTHFIHICVHMLSYAFICTSYALIWTNTSTASVHMHPYVIHMYSYEGHEYSYSSNIDSSVNPVASHGYPGGHGGVEECTNPHYKVATIQ